MFFYGVWLVLGGSTALKLVAVFAAKTASVSHKGCRSVHGCRASPAGIAVLPLCVPQNGRSSGRHLEHPKVPRTDNFCTDPRVFLRFDNPM
uniref:Putative secreted protein n=1 Tax=Ixodes scapularis TaxID=6945 RepID=A0A4D5RFY6_IXOSC